MLFIYSGSLQKKWLYIYFSGFLYSMVFAENMKSPNKSDLYSEGIYHLSYFVPCIVDNDVTYRPYKQCTF